MRNGKKETKGKGQLQRRSATNLRREEESIPLKGALKASQEIWQYKEKEDVKKKEQLRQMGIHPVPGSIAKIKTLKSNEQRTNHV